jgi:hypothetical protein
MRSSQKAIHLQEQWLSGENKSGGNGERKYVEKGRELVEERTSF